MKEQEVVKAHTGRQNLLIFRMMNLRSLSLKRLNMTFCMLQTSSKAHRSKQASAVQAISHHHKSLDLITCYLCHECSPFAKLLLFYLSSCISCVHIIVSASQTKEVGENNLQSEK